MGAESRLRQAHRDAIRKAYPRALIVGQPANAFTGSGRQDFYVVVSGRFVAPELKTGIGRATPVQLARIQKTRHAGGWSDVVRSPDQTLALIAHALKGGSVWDNLFSDTSPAKPEPEIRAFSEPQVQDAVELNGAVPGGDGMRIDPPADYPFAIIIQRLDALDRKVDALAQTVITRAVLTASREAPSPGFDLLTEPEEPALLPPEEATAPPKPPRSRRKA